MVLTLKRGFYCPKDRSSFRHSSRSTPRCESASRALSRSRPTPDRSNDLRLGVRADRTFLHDTEGVVQKDLEIQEYTDPRNDPMIPTRSCSSRRSL
jgi:hypothetical protein